MSNPSGYPASANSSRAPLRVVGVGRQRIVVTEVVGRHQPGGSDAFAVEQSADDAFDVDRMVEGSAHSGIFGWLTHTGGEVVEREVVDPVGRILDDVDSVYALQLCGFVGGEAGSRCRPRPSGSLRALVEDSVIGRKMIRSSLG